MSDWCLWSRGWRRGREREREREGETRMNSTSGSRGSCSCGWPVVGLSCRVLTAGEVTIRTLCVCDLAQGSYWVKSAREKEREREGERQAKAKAGRNSACAWDARLPKKQEGLKRSVLVLVFHFGATFRPQITRTEKTHPLNRQILTERSGCAQMTLLAIDFFLCPPSHRKTLDGLLLFLTLVQAINEQTEVTMEVESISGQREEASQRRERQMVHTLVLPHNGSSLFFISGSSRGRERGWKRERGRERERERERVGIEKEEVKKLTWPKRSSETTKGPLIVRQVRVTCLTAHWTTWDCIEWTDRTVQPPILAKLIAWLMFIACLSHSVSFSLLFSPLFIFGTGKEGGKSMRETYSLIHLRLGD